MSSEESNAFVNAAQAARLMGLTARHVYRLIEDGHLVARHKNKRRLEIALADVEAWIETHPREADPLAQLRDVQEQFRQVLERIAALENQFHAFRTSTQEELILLREEVQRGDLQEALNRMLLALSESRGQEGSWEKEETANDQRVFSPQSRLDIDLRERLRRALSVLERRGLPSGTVTIASFAKQHGVKPRTALGHCKKTQIFTRYDRPKAKILKCEWWVTPEQQGLLIGYWKQRQFPFDECPKCPHVVVVERVNK